MDRPDTVLRDHGIAIHNGRIHDLAKQDLLHTKYSAQHVIQLHSHAVIPGLVNAHTHAAMNLFKGIGDDLELMTWLETLIWPAEKRFVSPDFVRTGTRLAIAEMIRGGTTCFNDMYFFPDETGKVASEMGIRCVLGLILIDSPTVWANTPSEYVSKGTDVHDYFRNNPLITTAFAPHAPYTVNDQSLRHIGILAEELDIPIHMHLHETTHEIQTAVNETGMRPLERIAKLGLLSPRLIAVHMTDLTEYELDKIAFCGSHIVHCPESNLKLGSGFCPLNRIVERGINIALGTDSAASNNDLDMIGEMRTATLLAKGIAKSAAAVPAGTILQSATIGGALALGLANEIGTINIGKAADLTAIDLNRIATQPCYDPISQIVFASSRDQVTDVWIAGNQLLKGGNLIGTSVSDLISSANHWMAIIGGNDDK